MLQRFAVTLRDKDEYHRAEKLLSKAIQVKKSINKGSEKNEDIAYLYKELAVTLQSAGEITKAMTCVRKVVAIYEALGKL